ncbi:MAG: hypothetical protein ACI85K_000946 [Hyphomicrobiaceae bacterium]|jgi:hypothetical protein
MRTQMLMLVVSVLSSLAVAQDAPQAATRVTSPAAVPGADGSVDEQAVANDLKPAVVTMAPSVWQTAQRDAMLLRIARAGS